MVPQMSALQFNYPIIGGWGVNPTGKSFRVMPGVRACVRARGLVTQWNWISKVLATIFPFAFFGAPSFPFPLLGATSFPLSLPPPPKTSYLLSNFSWALGEMEVGVGILSKASVVLLCLASLVHVLNYVLEKRWASNIEEKYSRVASVLSQGKERRGDRGGGEHFTNPGNHEH